MTTIYHTTDRLIDEQLDALFATAWQLDNQFARLVAAARSLHEQHRVNAKGRCRICSRRPPLRCTSMRICTVYAALSFYLTQPNDLVLREIPRPMFDVDQTIELPSIRYSGSPPATRGSHGRT